MRKTGRGLRPLRAAAMFMLAVLMVFGSVAPLAVYGNEGTVIDEGENNIVRSDTDISEPEGDVEKGGELNEDSGNSASDTTESEEDTSSGESLKTVGETPVEFDLQTAINESKPGDTITITEDIALTKTLVIPAGKDITIKSKGCTISGNKSSNLSKLITVEEGAAVTFADITLSGATNGDSIIDSKGKVTINDGTVVTSAHLSYFGGAIQVSGANAGITINGGTIKKNVFSNQLSGAVRVSDGASLLMTGGKICDNEVRGDNSANSSGGIYMTTGAKGTITGGEISGNKSIRGSAVILFNIYDNDKSKRVTLEIKGGTISNNTCASSKYITGSGAVHIEGNAEVIMTGGKITGNTGVMGAGVCAVDPGVQKHEEEMRSAFVLNGGEISGNSGWVGGGIYSYTNGVELVSGKIINNTAGNHGGGVYSEGNTSAYSSIYVDNALVTGNKAQQGGGLWFCPTGTANIKAEDEIVVFDNTATGAGDDFVSASKQAAYTVTLPDRLKSGDRIYWYEDGKVSSAQSIIPIIIKDAPRYGKEGASTTPVSVKNSSKSYALKAVTDPTAKKIAAANCTLLISGNEAAHGGGIAANGGVNDTNTIYSKQELVVKKVWDDGGNPEEFEKIKPESVKFTLVIDGRRLDSVELNEDNGWTQSFYDISEDIPLDKITVSEEEIPGFTVSYSEPVEDGGEITITATNKYAPDTGGLAVSKTVEGSRQDKEKDFTFSVTLDDKTINGTYGEMVFKNGVSTFTLKHGGKAVATGLPDGVSYTVKEINSKGYTVKVKGGKTGTIVAKETAKVEFINSRDLPGGTKTGDGSNPAGWLAVMALSVMVALAAGRRYRKDSSRI